MLDKLQVRLTELNYNEILMYLGHRGQTVTEDIKAQIHRCMEQVTERSYPRMVYRILPLENGNIAGLPMEGNDIKDLLKECNQAVLVAMTLGPAVEQLLMRYEVMNMSDALVMDACASVAIENVANNFEADVRKILRADGLYLTSRFSPGYGDLPISTQRELCDALNANKRIGLTVTENFIMVPRKSVTAVMGISSLPQKLRKGGCEVCSMFMTCQFRKCGQSCEE